MKLNKGLVLGVSLASISILLAGLFFIRDYHAFYWATPFCFISLTMIGIPSALCGSFLVGNNLLIGGKRRLWLLVLGAVIASVGGLLGLAAIFLAFGVSQTGYWGSPSYHNYHGDYMLMGFQITSFQLSIVPGIIGGFLIGFSLPRKRKVSLSE